MFTCYFIRRKLTEYDEGTLTANAKRKVDRHLSRCAECMGSLYTLRKTQQVVAELNNEPGPRDDYWHQVWQKLRARLFQH
ncbi:MAG: zf-HC2 domain-containing protein [bacterium]|nr:zf-HC2 domain-containing protein [bacterium]